MSGKSIQLSFGAVRDKSKEKSIKLNLPPNYKKHVLFDQLPYLCHMENPAIEDVIKDDIEDNLSLQKYLLATWFLKDRIQDSLDMIVTDGKFNDVSVRRTHNTKYPSVIKKSNPIDVVSKDKAKFDTQNPIIGTLLTQIQSGKTNEKVIEKQLRGAPSIKDSNIAERLERLKKYNRRNNDDDDDDDDDYNDDDDDPPPTPIFDAPPYYPSSPSENDTDIEDGLNPTQKFLLGDRSQKEKIAVAVGEKATIATGEKKLDFWKILANYF